MMGAESLLQEILHARVDWIATQEDPYTFKAMFGREIAHLRLNDFPEEPLCTVSVADTQIDIDDFPSQWTLPKHRGETTGEA